MGGRGWRRGVGVMHVPREASRVVIVLAFPNVRFFTPCILYRDILRCNCKLISVACVSSESICCVISTWVSGCQLCLPCLLYCAATCKSLHSESKNPSPKHACPVKDLFPYSSIYMPVLWLLELLYVKH